MNPLSNEQLDELREIVDHPGWKTYLRVVEDLMLDNFQQIFGLAPDKPESFVKFVELKGRLDQLKEVSYFFERELAMNPEEVESVDSTYSGWFSGLLRKLMF